MKEELVQVLFQSVVIALDLFTDNRGHRNALKEVLEKHGKKLRERTNEMKMS